MKRYSIFFVLIIMLLGALLSGCGVKVEAPPDEVNTTPVADEKRAVVSFGFIDMTTANDQNNSVSLAVHNTILEKFNLDIRPVTLSKDKWKEDIAWMASVDQMPDVFYHDLFEDRLQFREFIDRKLIRSIPKEYWAPLPNLSPVLSWYEETYNLNGEMFFIPRTYQTMDQTHGSSNSYFYRKDWALKTDTMPSEDVAFDSVVRMLNAYVGSDPNGNAAKDTWGITGYGGLEFLKQAFLEPFGVRQWMYEEGKWVPGLLSNRAKEAMAWASQLYRDGVIDPSIATQTREEAVSKFLSGKSGALVTRSYPMDIKAMEAQFKVYHPGISINEQIAMMPLYTTPRGEHFNEVETFRTGTLFSSNLDDNGMKKTLALFDWLYSEDGRRYITYGVVGEHYDTSNGIQSTLVNTETNEVETFAQRNMQYGALANLASWNLDLLSDEVPMKSGFEIKGSTILENDLWPWSYSDAGYFTEGMLTPEICIFDLERVAGPLLIRLMSTTMNFETDWQTYVDECSKEFNIEAASQEVADRYAEIEAQKKEAEQDQ